MGSKFLFRLGARLLCVLPILSYAQKPSFTANNIVSAYTSDFAYGSNPGYYGGYNNNATSDKLMADLMNRAGFHTSRPALYDYFLEQYGTNVRLNEFKYYTETLGMKELTLFVSGPSEQHRETTTITCGGVTRRSQMFKNLYMPIWDDSTNGKTPINDQNYYAAYVYKLVKNYGKYVRFYEVWNEPDFSYGSNSWATPGTPNNWWDNNPSPCDLDNMHAQATAYIRTLRITYEVVKALDPNAYVTTGGLGYESFLDVILRNTDNPDGGKVTAEYPLKGGAYFDVLSYHVYPQYSLSKWDNSINGFKYSRHSDIAAQNSFVLKDKFKSLLGKYGYNGTTYPNKHIILTEVNIPRKQYTGLNFIGSAEAQRNFIIKTFVLAQKQDIRQMYVYTLGDMSDEATSTAKNNGFDLMGMYYNLNKATPATATLTPAGIASKSTSDFLYTYKYDAIKTAAMNLPATVDGGAFTKGTETRYVLWAKTTTDLSEVANANYSFPNSFGVTNIVTRPWDNGIKPSSASIVGSTVALTASPIFVTVSGQPTIGSSLVANAGSDKTIALPLDSVVLVGSAVATGSTVASFAWTKVQGPAVLLKGVASNTLVIKSFAEGTYVFEMVVKDDKGNMSTDQVQVVVTKAIPPVAGYKISFPQVSGYNKWKDQASNTFYKSTIRVQVETSDPVAVASVDFYLNSAKVTDGWADVVSGSVPLYVFHNTYYSLAPGVYQLKLVVRDKNGGQTETSSSFTIVNETAPIQGRLEATNETIGVVAGPYLVYDLQGVVVAQGSSQIDVGQLGLPSGSYILRTHSESVRFFIQR